MYSLAFLTADLHLAQGRLLRVFEAADGIDSEAKNRDARETGLASALPVLNFRGSTAPLISRKRSRLGSTDVRRKPSGTRPWTTRNAQMKIIICFRHLKCIWRKSRSGMDYTWHLQHLLREFGCGRFAMTGKAYSLINSGPNDLAFSPN